MSILYPNQYVHVLNSDTGEVRIEVGPKRIVLSGNEEVVGDVHQSIIVTESQYCVIKNPYDERKKQYLMGERQVIEGPAVINLHYQSRQESMQDVHVLSQGQALRLQALQTHEDKPAGKVWQKSGPCRFVPNKYTKVVRTINTILVNDGAGIYVRNVETSEKKLIEGPIAYLLQADEDFYYKEYTDIEQVALGLREARSYNAVPVHLRKGQVVCVLDDQKNERYISGPQSYLLQPEERVKILELAAGKPKRPYQIKAAVINLGPDFMSDKFETRTKDNAHLSILVTYKWQFIVDDQQIQKVFSMPDFIGYSCTTLTSLIREQVSQFTFEEFHKNSVGILREALFADHEVLDSSGTPTKHHGHFFDVIHFLVTEIDVKEVAPVNPEVNALLNQSIKNNMRIVCANLEQEARLLAEKDRIKATRELAGLKSELIEIENVNLQLERVEKAKIAGSVKVLEAEYAQQGEELRTKGRQGVEIERMRRTIELLSTPEGKKYLELIRAEQVAKIDQQWYVASDTRLPLPLSRESHEDSEDGE